MAFRDHRKKQRLPLWCSTTFFFLILFLLLIFSVFRESGIFGRVSLIDYNYSSSCDYSDGMWVHDPTIRFRYDQTCKEIFKGWNCISSNKSNARDLLLWRWKPKSCHLPHLDPLHFLNRFRHKSIGFVGDSLNRNMFVSLVCTLKRASSEVRKWRPVGADRGFTFLQYNLTIAYHRTNLLARYGGLLAVMKEL